MRIWKWLWGSITNSFKFKLIGSLSLIIVFAFAAVGFYTYHSNEKLFREELSKQAWIANQEALSKLELKVQEMKRISQTIVFNRQIEEMISRYNIYLDSDKFQLYVEKQKIDELVNQLKSDAPYITGLYIFNLRGNSVYYSYNTQAINNLDAKTLRPIRMNTRDTSGELVWKSYSLPSQLETQGFRETIVASRLMKNNELKAYGILVIMIDESFLASGLTELTKDGADKVYLFNRSSDLLYTNDKGYTDQQFAGIEKDLDMWEKEGQLYSRSETKNPLTDSFLLISSKSLDPIQHKNRTLAINTMLAGLIIAAAASLFIMLALERLLRPLADLLKGLQRMRAGNLETRVTVRSKDELAFIGDSFNAMAEHVEQLIKKVYLTQLSEREAELKALQAQINPHFLHNFFNEVYWKLYMRGEQDTAELIGAVSEMLKHSLMPVQVPSTVQEEVRQIQNYVKIQAELFEANLEFDIETEETVLHYQVMRSLLQPLVENVFMHAFRGQLANKRLHIRIWEELEGGTNFLRIDIRDSGCGMKPELIHKLLHEKSADHGDRQRESIGVRNVARRIELLHGDPYRLEIDSRIGTGTRMSLVLPAASSQRMAG